MASTSAGKRTRGPNKQRPWARTPDHGLSVLRLALDTLDPVQRRRVEDMFSVAFAVRRAVQRDARARVRAYRAAHHERARDPAAARARLGLSREAFERAAYAHLDAAPHLRRCVTKALAMHLADSVWAATERHLFRDASGKTQGAPRPGGWFDFTRIPGRARSHTTARKWETYRLCGTLDGHRGAYTGPRGGFAQPRHMRPIGEPDGSWWDYAGPLCVVFSGLTGGTLVLPVRLPSSRCNQPILAHHLAEPSRWHKIDLVRRRDPHAPGGWRYEAHLMVLTTPYVSAATAARRQAAAHLTADRKAGIDVNVSNITVASHAHGRDLRVTRIERDGAAKTRSKNQAKRERRRLRALDRSRRAMNRAQYQLSKRQAKRARRREAAGLPLVDVIPAGPRIGRPDGKPLVAYRKDILSASYRRGRAAQAADAASTAQAKRDRARHIAGAIVREHGCSLVVENTSIAAWARHWGRSLAQLSPGMLVAAVTREAEAVGALAGMRGGVGKSLADRMHACAGCGLRGDRDAVSATLAACVVLGERGTPASAYVDDELARGLLYDLRTRRVLHDTLTFSAKGRQDVPTESTVLSARDGSFVADAGPTPDWFVVARRIVGMAPRSTPNETDRRDSTTSDRARMRTNLFTYRAFAQLRDSS